MGDPALWVSGASLVTTLGTAIYLNKRILALVEEMNKNKERLSTAIVEVSKMKPMSENVPKIAEVMRTLNIEGEKQGRTINDIREILMEVENTLYNMMPQVEDNTNLIYLMMSAINELQIMAKQNGWTIRNNISPNLHRQVHQTEHLHSIGQPQPGSMNQINSRQSAGSGGLFSNNSRSYHGAINGRNPPGTPGYTYEPSYPVGPGKARDPRHDKSFSTSPTSRSEGGQEFHQRSIPFDENQSHYSSGSKEQQRSPRWIQDESRRHGRRASGHSSNQRRHTGEPEELIARPTSRTDSPGTYSQRSVRFSLPEDQLPHNSGHRLHPQDRHMSWSQSPYPPYDDPRYRSPSRPQPRIHHRRHLHRGEQRDILRQHTHQQEFFGNHGHNQGSTRNRDPSGMGMPRSRDRQQVGDHLSQISRDLDIPLDSTNAPTTSSSNNQGESGAGGDNDVTNQILARMDL